MSTTKETTTTTKPPTNIGEDVKKRNPYKQLCGMKISPAPLQVTMEVPQKKFKAGFPYDPILGIYTKGSKSALPQICCMQT
jgi:hypothetical protein